MSSKKEKLLHEFIRRWWYALPEWPPAAYDYKLKLKENKLRLLDISTFRKAE